MSDEKPNEASGSQHDAVPAELPSSPAAPAAASHPAPPPQTERITGPLLCVQCSYDLLGLSREQKCPECGTSAAETLASVAAAPVAEHLKLRRGLLLIAIAMIGGMAWLLTGQAVIGYLAFSMAGIGAPSWLMIAIGIIVPGLSTAWVLLSAIGWSRITRAAGQMLPERSRMARAVGRIARLYALAYFVSAVAIAVIEIASLGPTDIEELMAAMVVLTLALWVVRTALGFGLLAEIATSCRAHRVRRTVRVLVWGAIALPIVIVGCTIGAAYFHLQTVAGLWIEYFIFGSSLGLAGIIIALGVCALVLRRVLAPFARGTSR